MYRYLTTNVTVITIAISLVAVLYYQTFFALLNDAVSQSVYIVTVAFESSTCGCEKVDKVRVE